MALFELLTPAFSSPLPWVVLGGFFLGGALSRTTRSTRRARHPEHAATRKWVLTCLLLSAAVTSGLLAVFVPGPSRIVDIRWAWVAGAAALAAFLAFRFRKAAGIPVVVLAAALVAAVALFLQSVRAFTGETEIATVRVISADPSSMRLELVPRGEPSALLTMKGTYFAPIVRVIIFDDLLVFLGAKTWYRFEGLTSFDDALRQQDTDFRFPQSAGISETLWTWFERNDSRIPGVKTAQTEFTGKRAKEFVTYTIRVRNDGGVEVAQK